MLNIMYTSVAVGGVDIWDASSAFLREILVSPLPRATILLGKILGGTTSRCFTARWCSRSRLCRRYGSRRSTSCMGLRSCSCWRSDWTSLAW